MWTHRLIGTDERDRFDVRMLADKIDSLVLAVYNVQQSWWRACPGEQIGEDHRSAWHAFRWFENGGVSTGDRDRKRPKGYHRREIEGTDGGSYAKGKLVGNYVHICGDIWRALPHLKRRNRGTRVHHLCNINQLRVIYGSYMAAIRRGTNEDRHRDGSRVCLCVGHLSRSESMRGYGNKYNWVIYVFFFNKLTQSSENVTFGIGHCLPILLYHVLCDFFLNKIIYYTSILRVDSR